MKVLEKHLDQLFAETLQQSEDFCRWLLSRTRFANVDAKLLLLRADNPWYRGQYKGKVRESETDILLVFERTDNGRRFALHIENKIDSPFTPDQPELYRIRAAAWLGQAKWGSYQEFETILIAPASYHSKYKSRAECFDRYISHEDIARHIPGFSREREQQRA